MAINWATEQQQYNKIVIFSDSQEATHNLTINSRSVNKQQTNITTRIKQKIDKTDQISISLEWIPGHASIQFHDLIDLKTKEALGRNNIEIPSSLHEILTRIDNYSIQRWQHYYINTDKAKWYKNIEPTTTTKPKIVIRNRNDQKTISRLKLGRCLLNYYQHQNGLHRNGLCEYCGVSETIEHHIMVCNKYNYITKLQDNLRKAQLQPTLQNILTNTVIAEHLCRLITRQI